MECQKHFQNTHPMQTAVPRSKHGQYEEVGGGPTCTELHIESLHTNVRKKIYLSQNMLLVA